MTNQILGIISPAQQQERSNKYLVWFKPKNPWHYFNSDAILWKNKSKSSYDFPLNERCSIPNIFFKMCRQSKKHPFSITVFCPHSKVQHRFINDRRMLLCTKHPTFPNDCVVFLFCGIRADGHPLRLGVDVDFVWDTLLKNGRTSWSKQALSMLWWSL